MTEEGKYEVRKKISERNDKCLKEVTKARMAESRQQKRRKMEIKKNTKDGEKNKVKKNR